METKTEVKTSGDLKKVKVPATPFGRYKHAQLAEALLKQELKDIQEQMAKADVEGKAKLKPAFEDKLRQCLAIVQLKFQLFNGLNMHNMMGIPGLEMVPEDTKEEPEAKEAAKM